MNDLLRPPEASTQRAAHRHWPPGRLAVEGGAVVDWLEKNPTALGVLVNDMPAGIVIGDIATGMVIANGRAAELFAQSSDSSSIDGWLATVPVPDRLRVRRVVEDVVGSGTPQSFRHRIVAGNGTERWVDQSMAPVPSGDGAPTAFISTVTDVTGEERAREEHEASEDLAVGLVDAVGALVVVVDPGGRVQGVNETCEAVSGIAAEDFVGKTIFETLVPEDQRPAVMEAFAALLSGAAAYALETEINACGERRLISWTNTMLTNPDGSNRAIIATGIDVTEQRLLEGRLRQVDRLDSIGRLASGIAHDFKNTLGILQLRADRLADRHVDDQSRDDVETIHRTIAHSHGLISDLLTFSRQEVHAPRVVDVNTEVSDTMSVLTDLLSGHIVIELDLAADEPHATVDPVRLAQLLTNLTLNARDAMPDGGTLTVTTTAETIGPGVGGPAELADGKYARLSVADTGVGIEPGTVSNIFDPYFTTKPGGEGTGLGLAMVYGIVSQSGGAITVHSELGQGTTFDVWFPVVETTERAVTRSSPLFIGSSLEPDRQPMTRPTSSEGATWPSRSDRRALGSGARSSSGEPPTAIEVRVVGDFCTRIRRSSDLDAHREVEAHWQLETTPLGRGRFGVRSSKLELDDIAVGTYAARTPILERFAGTRETTTVNLTKPGEARHAGFCGVDLPPLTLAIMQPGADGEYMLPADVEVLNMQLPVYVVESASFERLTDPATTAIRLEHAAAVELTTMIHELHEGRTSRTPQAARDELLDLLSAALVGPQSPTTRLGPLRRHELYSRAVGLLRDDPAITTTLELARRLAVSRATLDAAFSEAIGVTVPRYLLRTRLVKARTDLQDPHRMHESISQIISDSGVDTGEFRRRYKHLFGETPSQTRLRSSQGGSATGRKRPS